MISVNGDPSKTLHYSEVLGALAQDPQFPLTAAGSFGATAKVPAKPKDWAEYRVAGSSVPRRDAAPKAYGTYPYVVNIKPQGIVHGRFAYPPSVGATLADVDESSIRGIGDARVVRVNGFAGVVATREWDAIRAIRALKTTWTPAASRCRPKLRSPTTCSRSR